MPSVFSGKPAALTLSLMLLALLSFSTSSSEPMTKVVVQTHMELYSSQSTVNRLCEVKNGRSVNGCTWQLGKGRYKIVALKPKSWCDWARLRTLGHETMHTLGFEHDDAYALQSRGNRVSWRADHCELTR